MAGAIGDIATGIVVVRFFIRTGREPFASLARTEGVRPAMLGGAAGAWWAILAGHYLSRWFGVLFDRIGRLANP
jgi:hypothetical protein